MSTTRAFVLLLLAFLSLQSNARSQKSEKPNLILILVDDLGYGDLGCYGQERLKTPRLDRMAAEGRRYTQFYAGSTVCAPSRCVLMTGLHTGHCRVRGNSKQGLEAEDVTLGEIMQSASYATGLVGKWGLGSPGSAGVPTKQGFDSFFGYLDQHHAHNYYPTHLYRGEEKVLLANVVPKEGKYGQGVATVKKDYSHDLFTEEALGFVREHATDPFFLYLAYTIPHANNEAGRRGMEVPDYGSFADEDWPDAEKGMAAMVERMDRDVGRLLDLLDELGIDENTLVLFTSDNGPHGEGGHDPEFFKSRGGLNGTKRDLTEGGIRVPTIARWPGRVPAGTVSDHIAAFEDIMPTFAEVGGAQAPDHVDGLSFATDLLGKAGQEAREELFWAFYERGGSVALRSGNWKLVEQPSGSPPRLYDLEADESEAHDLAVEQPEVVARLQARIAANYAPSASWRLPTPGPLAELRVTVDTGGVSRKLTPLTTTLLAGVHFEEGQLPELQERGLSLRHGKRLEHAQIEAIKVQGRTALRLHWIAHDLPAWPRQYGVELTNGKQRSKLRDQSLSLVNDPEGGGQWRDLRRGERTLWRHQRAYDPERYGDTFKTYHELHGLHGEGPITKGPGGLYTHHRGVFLGWSKTRAAGKTWNFWSISEEGAESQRHARDLRANETSGPFLARSASQNDWINREGRAVVRDTRSVGTWVLSKHALLMDWEITIEALDAEVELDGDPPHGGFQVRALQSVADDKSCEYLRPASASGGENDNWAESPWMLGRFPIGGNSYALMHMDHPENPRPTVYNTRDYGRFGSFFKRTVKPGEPLTLRYRLLLMDSAQHPSGTEEDVQVWIADWTDPPIVTIK